MRKLFSVFLFFVCLAGSFFAAQYNFGTIQQNKNLVAEPGENITITVFFFIDSAYGDRNTHINLNEEVVPEGWAVDFDPALHEVVLNVSGIITTFDENLYSEPMPLLDAIPETPAPGYRYVMSPSGKGYLQVKPVNITIRVANDAKLGDAYDVTIGAFGSWFGESGTVSLQQSRSFNYKVAVVSKTYSEQIVTPEANAGANVSATPVAGGLALDQNLLLYAVIAVLLLAVIVLAVKAFKPRKEAPQQPSSVQ
ncbi:hypothetical protein HY992_05525 [Candidatus Micrarchaeota archaeon]|nr:hypothetical protein [Candidatus Micrarchaeota archaeon]